MTNPRARLAGQMQLLSMSALSGFVALRRYLATHPHVEVADAVSAVRRMSADDAHHDYEAAIVWHTIVDSDISTAGFPEMCRSAILSLVRSERPWWTRLAPLGRERLRAALNQNEVQCFSAAGLLSETPAPDVVTWWDALAHGARTDEVSGKLAQGREAERLTLAFERRRLERLGIPREPKWTAVDDNTAGYDVLSFDVGLVNPVNRLIEVKSCSREMIEIFVSRNEWETALASAPHYHFHVWHLPEQRLIELSVDDVSRHIPINRGEGAWQSVGIRLR